MSSDVFDISDPLPTGTTLLEASAGTGKTWTIGALVTRYVAEGVALLEQMLVVTFGRAASQELRERVRAQLVEAEHALAGDGVPRPDSDLLDLLLDCDGDERARRHRRIREALARFDAATIATTHQFCSMVLGSLGVAGDTDSRARLVEDLDDLLTEVVDDLYLRAFAWSDDDPVFSAVRPTFCSNGTVSPHGRSGGTSWVGDRSEVRVTGGLDRWLNRMGLPPTSRPRERAVRAADSALYALAARGGKDRLLDMLRRSPRWRWRLACRLSSARGPAISRSAA